MPPASAQQQRFSVDWPASSRTSKVTSKVKVTSSCPVESLEEQYARLTGISRLATAIGVILLIAYRNTIQLYLDQLWVSVRDEPWFKSAFFETFYTIFIYFLIIASYPYLMHYMPYLQRFKVSEEVTYVHQTVMGIVKEMFFHAGPLLVLDMTIVKRYWGVPSWEISDIRKDWIVTTRALPEAPPNFLVLCVHVIGSVLLFDCFFTLIHYTLHRNVFLYKHVHSLHHTHEIVHAHVTNQLSVVERILQILSANFALKCFGSHPLTRVAFVPVFLWLLIENHTGYDLPWGPHRILPQGFMGGPGKHHLHHTQGHGNYQPFFNYIDNWLERRKKNKQS